MTPLYNFGLEAQAQGQNQRHNREMHELFAKFINTCIDLETEQDGVEMTVEQYRAWTKVSAELQARQHAERMALIAEMRNQY